MMPNAEQEEELDTLHAIYGEDCEFDHETRTCKVSEHYNSPKCCSLVPHRVI